MSAYAENNYCAGWAFEGIGAVLTTGQTLEHLKAEFVSALKFHVENMASSGESLPQWLVKNDFEIEFELDLPDWTIKKEA